MIDAGNQDQLSGRQWVNKLSRDQAVTAVVHLQRDVGLM